MGLFSKKQTVVSVAFRELSEPPPKNELRSTYRYVSTLTPAPVVGDRLMVRGSDGKLAPVIVVAVEVTKATDGLAPVERAVTAEELDQATQKAAKDLDTWFRMARRSAGLSVSGRLPGKPPGDLPEIPPADGEASREDADAWGRGWYRIWKLAEEHGRGAEEIAAFKSKAYRWFAVRDRS
ncbi:hypothetical protein [Microcella alkaliphila]|uniref:Uncharacterized protein n=1 Tax=Microcella alkaliphila TaxID=279828 RepID=A0A0U5BLU4_9MICO|nr:hypothetical protein [Microcella alkaliphila]BAU32501.1 uncharacterized protein MalAC0309_1650 [Microcella alkaliphila]